MHSPQNPGRVIVPVIESGDQGGNIIPFPRPTPLEGVPMTGDEFDAEIRRLGFTQLSFADYAGIGGRTARTYAAKGPPPLAEVLLRLLAQVHVPGGWRGNRLREAPSIRETREAIEPAVQHIIGRAVEQHWDPTTIADALSAIADELRQGSAIEPRRATSA